MTIAINQPTFVRVKATVIRIRDFCSTLNLVSYPAQLLFHSLCCRRPEKNKVWKHSITYKINTSICNRKHLIIPLNSKVSVVFHVPYYFQLQLVKKLFRRVENNNVVHVSVVILNPFNFFYPMVERR